MRPGHRFLVLCFRPSKWSYTGRQSPACLPPWSLAPCPATEPFASTQAWCPGTVSCLSLSFFLFAPLFPTNQQPLLSSSTFYWVLSLWKVLLMFDLDCAVIFTYPFFTFWMFLMFLFLPSVLCSLTGRKYSEMALVASLPTWSVSPWGGTLGQAQPEVPIP